MPNVSYSPAAERDVRGAIDRYIRVGGAGLAGRFVQALSRSARRSAEFPASGSTAWASGSNNLAGIRHQSLRAPFQKWLIFYRSSPDSIVVVRLLHAARDFWKSGAEYDPLYQTKRAAADAEARLRRAG